MKSGLSAPDSGLRDTRKVSRGPTESYGEGLLPVLQEETRSGHLLQETPHTIFIMAFEDKRNRVAPLTGGPLDEEARGRR